MLFEQEKLTPGTRAQALSRLFHSSALRTHGETPPTGGEHVPIAVLTAHGELERRLRYMLEAALATRPAAAKPRLRRIERLLDTLPESIMRTLPATPDQDWMLCYRELVRLHDLLDEAGLCESAEEYAGLITKMSRLAEAVSAGSAVSVNAGSMFTLWLMQSHLRRYSPRKRRAPRRKKRRTPRKRTARAHPAAPSA